MARAREKLEGKDFAVAALRSLAVMRARISRRIGLWKLAASRSQRLPFVAMASVILTAAWSLSAGFNLFASGYSSSWAQFLPDFFVRVVDPKAAAGVCFLWTAVAVALCRVVDNEKGSEDQIQKASRDIAESGSLKERAELEASAACPQPGKRSVAKGL